MMNNNIAINNMLWQCVYNNSDASCPIWLWIVLGLVVVGFIGFVIWVIKETWIW